jgi:hypothetical protein
MQMLCRRDRKSDELLRFEAPVVLYVPVQTGLSRNIFRVFTAERDGLFDLQYLTRRLQLTRTHTFGGRMRQMEFASGLRTTSFENKRGSEDESAVDQLHRRLQPTFGLLGGRVEKGKRDATAGCRPALRDSEGAFSVADCTVISNN